MISEGERKEMLFSARLRGLQESCREIVRQDFRQENPGGRLSADAMTMLDIWFDEREDFLEQFILHCYDPEWGVQEGVGLCHTFVQRLLALVAGECTLEDSVRCELIEQRKIPGSFFRALEELEYPKKSVLWGYVWERIVKLKYRCPRIGNEMSLGMREVVRAIGVVFGRKKLMTNPTPSYLSAKKIAKNDAAGRALADAFEQAWRAADPELFIA